MFVNAPRRAINVLYVVQHLDEWNVGSWQAVLKGFPLIVSVYHTLSFGASTLLMVVAVVLFIPFTLMHSQEPLKAFIVRKLDKRFF